MQTSIQLYAITLPCHPEASTVIFGATLGGEVSLTAKKTRSLLLPGRKPPAWAAFGRGACLLKYHSLIHSWAYHIKPSTSHAIATQGRLAAG
jgi:hypothetical protein